MFGIDDPFIILPYLLSVATVAGMFSTAVP